MGATPSTIMRLPLSPLLEAVEAWQLAPGPESAANVGVNLTALADRLGIAIGRLRISATPLPDLELDLGAGIRCAEFALRAAGRPRPIGYVRIAGPSPTASDLARALELIFSGAQARAASDRTSRQLAALEQAVRSISEVLDVDRVLQVIVDRMRELVEAQYAAIGIVDDAGAIERFITSGMGAAERRRIGHLPRGHGLLGLIIREGRTYRTADIAADLDRYGFPPHHPEMGSFLGTPVLAKAEPVGRLYLTNKLGAAEFSEDDAALVEMFALHAGIAIENARLHDRVGRLAVVEERERISRDLHDSVIQSVYAQTLALEDVPDLAAADPSEARRRVDDAIEAMHVVIRDVRNFIFGLGPVGLADGGLTAGLDRLAREIARGGLDVQVAIDDPSGALDGLGPETDAELLAISREALTNIARHAHAQQAWVRLSTAAGLRLEISDDGAGFDATRGRRAGHHGLVNMQARSAAIAANFEIASEPEHGTRIVVARASSASVG